MSATARSWEEWERRLRDGTPTEPGLRSRLLAVAIDVGAAVGRTGSLADRWARVGIDVRAVRMRSRGRCDVSGASRGVLVNEQDNPYAKSFTVAHEVAHLLLNGLPAEGMASIGLSEEERLCDEFARDLLVPPAELVAQIDVHRPPAPGHVLRLCGVFGVNPSVMLAALKRERLLRRHAYLLARYRGHYLRAEVKGFRIESVAGPPELFWPHETRLETVGLDNLSAAAGAAEHGALLDGHELCVRVPLRRRRERCGRRDPATESAVAGPVSWRAIRQGRETPYLVALLDCDRLASPAVSLADRPDEQAPARAYAVSTR